VWAVIVLSTSQWPATDSIELRETTVGMVLREGAERFASAAALVEGTPGHAEDRRRWTFETMLADAERVAGALLERFEPGERVAVWAPNIPEWILLELGVALAGMVLVTVNPAYRSKELEYVLRQSRASGIFLVREYRGNPMAACLEEVWPGLRDLREAVSFTDWDAFVATAPSSARLPEVRPTDPAQVQYTSGTTGFPKGALLRHRGITNNARIWAILTGLEPGDAYAHPFPMFHTAGCATAVLGTLQAGARHVPVYAFDPFLMLELMEAERATLAAGVPTVLISLLECPDLATRDLSALRVVISGATTVPAELVRRVEETLGVDLLIMFGTTECSPMVSAVRLDDSVIDKAETIGRPVPQTEVKVVEVATGETAVCGAVGELCVRGYCVMTGYFDMPDQTAAAIDADGWYHTGDLASMDDRGFLRIAGRLKEMIIRGGENIYPREIEEVLFEHPKVADVVVVGVPDAKWGEQVAAFIRSAPGEPPTREELLAYCRATLASHKTPRHWEFVDEFPLTASGKVKKFVLRERFAAEHPPP
jgi:fatty-acyl-CoA synthase